MNGNRSSRKTSSASRAANSSAWPSTKSSPGSDRRSPFHRRPEADLNTPVLLAPLLLAQRRLAGIEDCPILRVSLLNCANDQIDSIGLLGVDENDHAAAAELQHFAKRRHALAPVLTEVAVVANAIVTNFGKSEVTHLTLLPRGP